MPLKNFLVIRTNKKVTKIMEKWKEKLKIKLGFQMGITFDSNIVKNTQLLFRNCTICTISNCKAKPIISIFLDQKRLLNLSNLRLNIFINLVFSD
jgi:hypothetical protein